MAPNWALFYFTCYGNETYIKLKLITSTFTWWSPNFWFGAQLGAFLFGAQFAFLFYMLWEWDIHQIKANNKYFHMVVTKFLIWRPIGCLLHQILRLLFIEICKCYGNQDIHQIKANNKDFYLVLPNFKICSLKFKYSRTTKVSWSLTTAISSYLSRATTKVLYSDGFFLSSSSFFLSFWQHIYKMLLLQDAWCYFSQTWSEEPLTQASQKLSLRFGSKVT